MTNLTMKDLAIKLDSLGVYVDSNNEIVQVNNNEGIIDTADLSLNAYVKTLESKRSQRKKAAQL